MEKLEKTYKQSIKYILSLPITVAVPTIYVRIGALLIESVFHKKTFVLFGSLCRLEDSVRKQVASRQLAIKTFESTRWFVAVRELYF